VCVTEIKPETYSLAFLTAISHGLAFKATDRSSTYLMTSGIYRAGSSTLAFETETVQFLPTTEDLVEGQSNVIITKCKIRNIGKESA
jgi:hypothetical protein